MNDQSFSLLFSILALITGGIIGLLFGLIQNQALLHNKKLQKQGKLKRSLLIMPGSFTRIAILLFALAVVQITCPIFFSGNIQWLVSAGILISYAYTLLKQLNNRISDNQSNF
jgi:hypothetical protein